MLPGLRLVLAAFGVGTGILVVRLAEPGRDVGGLLAGLGLAAASAGAAWWGRRRGLPAARLTAWELAVDIALVTLICHSAGGVDSPFRWLYCVPVLLGAHYLGARAAVPLAVASSLALVTGRLAQSFGWAEAAPGGASVAMGPVLETQFTVGLLLLAGVGGGLLADRAARRERELAAAAAALDRTRVETRNIVDNLGSGLLILDREGRLVSLNPAAERILGVFAEEVVGSRLETAFGDSLSPLASCARQVLGGGAPIDRCELTVTRWDTVVVTLGLSVSHLRDAAGQPAGVIVIFQDLTDVVRMRERVREADRLAAVGELSASIAHEIRNPLGSIRGSVEILAGELELAGHQARLLQLILKESARVNTIIDDFLGFARLRPPQRQLLACAQLLGDLELQIRQHVTFQGGGVAVECRCERAGLAVLADPAQLTQLLLNLAINACEAMEYRGKLALVARAGADGASCELCVLDSGPGLSEEARANLFKPFFTTKRKGTGLGLPMVARIVHAHDGTVEAGESAAGGAAFTVRLPLAAARPAAGPGPGAAGEDAHGGDSGAGREAGAPVLAGARK